MKYAAMIAGFLLASIITFGASGEILPRPDYVVAKAHNLASETAVYASTLVGWCFTDCLWSER